LKVTAADYKDHRALALAGLNLWENHGWMVWDRVGDEDLLLWLSPYRIMGRHPDTPFAVDDIALSQTMVLRSARRSEMHDGPFLAVGYDFGDYLPGDSLNVCVDDKRATWRIGGRSFIAQPPVWRIQGSHAGVDVDLTLEAAGPPLWLTDPAKSIEEIQERWFLVCARARGHITHKWQVLEIDGYANQERHVHCGTRYDPVRLLSSRGITFHCLAVEGRHVIICSRPSLGLAWARLILGDHFVDFQNCRVVEAEFWVDPQSRIQIPSAWHIACEGPAGSLEITAHGFSRAYYLWPYFKSGCTVLYWWLGEAKLRYELASGEKGCFPDVQYVVHDNRLLYRQHRDD
jgi:hypothetical protein